MTPRAAPSQPIHGHDTPPRKRNADHGARRQHAEGAQGLRCRYACRSQPHDKRARIPVSNPADHDHQRDQRHHGFSMHQIWHETAAAGVFTVVQSASPRTCRPVTSADFRARRGAAERVGKSQSEIPSLEDRAYPPPARVRHLRTRDERFRDAVVLILQADSEQAGYTVNRWMRGLSSPVTGPGD